MRMRLRGFLLLALSTLIAFAQSSRADAVVVTADRLIDVPAGRVVEHPRVPVVDGRITAVETQGDNAKPFAKMVEWSMTPMQAIQGATATAAEALGRTSDVGAIAVGPSGDLVGVAGDPLKDVTRLETVAFVMRGGAVVKSPTD